MGSGDSTSPESSQDEFEFGSDEIIRPKYLVYVLDEFCWQIIHDDELTNQFTKGIKEGKRKNQMLEKRICLHRIHLTPESNA